MDDKTRAELDAIIKRAESIPEPPEDLTPDEQVAWLIKYLAADRVRREAFRRVAFSVRLKHGSVRGLVDSDVITPERVRAYLVAHDWECRKERPDYSSWWKHGAGTVHLLSAPDDGGDYARQTAYLVEQAADVERVGEMQVIDEIGHGEVPKVYVHMMQFTQSGRDTGQAVCGADDGGITHDDNKVTCPGCIEGIEHPDV